MILSALLERVTKAGGEDRNLARDIFTALGFTTAPDSYGGWYVVDPELDSDITISIDACLALVERKLPGWWLDTWNQVGSDSVAASLQEHFVDSDEARRLKRRKIHSIYTGMRSAPTLPLAILICLLRALIAEEPKP